MDKYFRIKGYEDYFITKSGKIFSSLSHKNLRYTKNNQGYFEVALLDRRLDKEVILLVHKITAIQFIPNPNNLSEVRHKDGNFTNNSVYNLEWCTSEYKLRQDKFTKFSRRITDSPKAKLTEYQVIQIYKDFEYCKNKAELAKKYNVSISLIKCILHGTRWSKTYKYFYGKEPTRKIFMKKKLTREQIKDILYKYYIEVKKIPEIEKETNISVINILCVVRGIKYPKTVNELLLEIKKELDNQQPNT